ncbi:MAG: MerR family transcriptional regulator [Kiloniellaceae bacterium]|nr:MerR family transcriptional regulator [Kiloniellaceae bacterium]
MTSSPLTIGDLAKATGTKVVTVRYYERIGLLPPPRRTGGNYRAYEPMHLDRLRFIRRCRDLGFTLDQVRELLHLSSQEGKSCGEVDRIAAAHLAATEEKIADLTRLAGQLRRIISRCEGGGVIADCRIIEALSPCAEEDESC